VPTEYVTMRQYYTVHISTHFLACMQGQDAADCVVRTCSVVGLGIDCYLLNLRLTDAYNITPIIFPLAFAGMGLDGIKKTKIATKKEEKTQ
jgi:hypothetical protein